MNQEQHSDLAKDIDRSIVTLSNQIDTGDTEPNNPLGIPPEQALAILRPLVASKATNEPRTILKVLAVVHLETGELLAAHTDSNPEELI